ncbi:hypothetical protein MMC13_004634 [Lambiella insularis]|nr:hypothetical protein [Lambiella insularis]
MSLAEMASMAPTSGGQYHWVSELAPPKYQKVLSYVTGWMSVLSWQAGAASGSFLTGTVIQALLAVNDPNYSPTNWQGTLFVCAMALLLYIANIWGWKLTSMVQNFLLFLHIGGFLAVIIVLWVMAPHQSASSVFTGFTNEGGWSSMGLSLMVGQIIAIYGSLGANATVHMSEEVREAGRYVPIAMFWFYVSNGLIALIALILLITYLFSIDSVDAALADPSGYPLIHVFSSAVPLSGVNALTILVLLLVFAANIDYNASTSRQTFAFARDRGLPFATWIGAVHHRKGIPVNAFILSCSITALLSLINIGSDAAFNAIISVQVAALMLSYSVSISCILYRRLAHPERLLPARWSLGRWGLAVNIIGLAYVLFAFFWSFWPNATPVDLQSFNWSVVIFVGVLAVVLVMYVAQGRLVYVGPVMQVERRN